MISHKMTHIKNYFLFFCHVDNPVQLYIQHANGPCHASESSKRACACTLPPSPVFLFQICCRLPGCAGFFRNQDRRQHLQTAMALCGGSSQDQGHPAGSARPDYLPGWLEDQEFGVAAERHAPSLGLQWWWWVIRQRLSQGDCPSPDLAPVQPPIERAQPLPALGCWAALEAPQGYHPKMQSRARWEAAWHVWWLISLSFQPNRLECGR